MSVHIVQTLCPQRHCILALAYDSASTAGAGLLEGTVDRAIAAGYINPWCGLCGARRETWTTEDRETAYPTMDAARPHLERLERQQAQTRAMFGGAGRN